MLATRLAAVGAASPGFDLRPARRRATLQILPNSPPPASASPTAERSPFFGQHGRAAGGGDGDQRSGHLRRMARERGRTKSLSGGVYVGRTSFDGEQGIAVRGLGVAYDARAAGEGDVFGDGAGVAQTQGR